MSELKKYFTEHRHEFDDAEPAAGHFDRFEAKLRGLSGRPVVTTRRLMIYRIAASLLILITISAVFYELKTSSFRSRLGLGISSTELPADISEAISYYDGMAIKHLDEINILAATDLRARDLSESARKEIDALDENAATLKQAFCESPGNERILAALVQNQQMKEKITSTILDQMNQLRKQY